MRERALARVREICLGHRGWVGVRLDRGAPWDEIAGVMEEAYLERAPKSLRRKLERD